MSPKAKVAAPAKAAKPTKASAKPAAKAASNGKSAKGSKAAPAAEVAPVNAEGADGQVDPDELEEQQDAAAAGNGEGGNAAALAAAGSSTEMSASFKNFRHHPDMENFYRFIYENDLRHEALAIIDEIIIEKQNRKAIKASGKSAH